MAFSCSGATYFPVFGPGLIEAVGMCSPYLMNRSYFPVFGPGLIEAIWNTAKAALQTPFYFPVFGPGLIEARRATGRAG